jgi:hypothetical protein
LTPRQSISRPKINVRRSRQRRRRKEKESRIRLGGIAHDPYMDSTEPEKKGQKVKKENKKKKKKTSQNDRNFSRSTTHID